LAVPALAAVLALGMPQAVPRAGAATAGMLPLVADPSVSRVAGDDRYSTSVGAVLLVRPDGIPSVVVSELKRLAPASIVVVGVLVGLLYLVAGSLTHESPRFRHLPPSAHPAH
jgi:hypothetical protein